MRYRKVKRVLSGLLTVAMLIGQTPEVFAAGAAESGDDDYVIEFVEDEDEEETESVSEDTASDNTASDNSTTEIPDETQDPQEDAVIEEADLDGLVAGEDYIEGRLVAVIEDETEAEALAAYYGGKLLSHEAGIAVIELGKLSVAQALAMEKYNSYDVEPDYIYKKAAAAVEDISGDEIYDDEEGKAVPKEPGWGDWYSNTPEGDQYLNVMDDNYQYMHEMVRTYAAWGVTTGNTGVRVAVIGSGVDASHPDFADYNGNNPRAICNVVGEYANVDVSGEGTHSAGIIAAGLKNGRPAVGIAPNVRILGIRVADDDAVVNSAALATAISSLADIKSEGEKVDIILLDTLIAGRIGSIYVKAEQEAISKAVKAGITVIAGAGDEGSNAKSYPACYDGVISVGAVNMDGSIASFSNSGTVVDIYAPGVDIASLGVSGTYYKRSSTSAAASVVAGVAALYMSVNGHKSPAEMEKTLIEAGTVEKKIISAAKIFKGDTRYPEVILNDGFGNISATFTGTGNKSNLVVPGDGAISLRSRNFAGKEGSNGNAVLVYSLDGNAPKVENGELVHGEVYTGSISYNTIYKDKKSKKTVTVIAAAITGIGVMSKTTSVTFTIDPKAVSKPMSLKIAGVPDNDEEEGDMPCIPAGYDIPLKYEASGIDTKTITWAITDSVGCTATISQNGVLRTKISGKKDGFVTVECKAASPKEIKCTVEFKVLNGVNPVGEIKLNTTKETLEYSDEDAGTYDLVIKTYTDINGYDIRYNEFLIDWSSSDESVAIVEPSDNREDKEFWKKATITAVGAGKCTIKCTPLDGSGKSASVSITVNRKIDSFRINGPQQVVRGKTYTLTATDFEPKESATKNVKWLLQEKTDGVTLDPLTGVLKIGKNKAEVGESFTVVATANGVTSEPLEIEIVKGTCDKLIVDTILTQDYYQIKRKTNGGIKSINLFSKNPAAVSENTTQTIVFANGYYKGDDLGLDSTFTSSDSSIVSVKATPDGGAVLTAGKKGKATIKCTYGDSSRKTVSFTVKVTDPVESIKVSGQSAIVVGKSAQFKAKEVLPETAGNKKVKWSIKDNVAGVTISKKGKVKLISTPAVEKVTVIAEAMDGSKVTGSMDFVVCTEKTKSLTIDTKDDPGVYKLKRAKKTDKLQSARLYTVNIPKNGSAENQLNVFTNSKYALDWTSSDPAIAKVEAAGDGTRAVITGLAKGSVTITAKAQDGSKKKASIKINVQVPASGLGLVPQDGQNSEYHFLAYGKSVELTASLGKSFGTPTNTKIKWEYDFCSVEVERDDDGNVSDFVVSEIDYDYDSLAKIFGFTKEDGKLTMPSKENVTKSGVIESDDEKNQFIFAITVRAISDEGLGYEASKTFIAVNPVKSLSLCYNDVEYKDGDDLSIQVNNSRSYYLKGNYGGTGGDLTTLISGVSVKSSDPAILSAYFDDSKGKLVITGHKKGKVTLTCTMKDGSGKSVKFQIKVNKD